MQEKKNDDLLAHITPTPEPLQVLVIESLSYLQELKEKIPQAQVQVVVADRTDVDSETFGAKILEHDYLAAPLPFPQESFDIILGDRLAELAENPQDILAGLAHYVKPTGYLLTSFQNIRHWRQLEDLAAGHFYALRARLFAREEFEKLLYACFYKEVFFHPLYDRAKNGQLQPFLAAGFENMGDDLEVAYYQVRARRSMGEIALLKAYFDKETRKELSKLLKRVEYNVDPEENARAVWQLYEQKGMFPDYLASFVVETSILRQTLVARLLQAAGDKAEAFCEALRRMAIVEEHDL